MKKLLCFVLALAMLLPTAVFADEASSKDMERVLLTVKSRVDIHPEHTEFTPFVYEDNDEAHYSFTWRTEDENAMTEVSADGEGRILSYYFFDRNHRSEKKITSLSLSYILDFAGDFVQKTLPEAFAQGSDLVLDRDSLDVYDLSYSINFIRTYNGIEVKDNFVRITVEIIDDVAYIKNMQARLDYDAVFEPEPQGLENPEAKYREAFPEELVYKDTRDTSKTGETILVYRFKDNQAGYILASDGTVVAEDNDFSEDDRFNSAAGSTESMKDEASDKIELTEKELLELAQVEKLLSKEEAVAEIKALPFVTYDPSMKNTQYNLEKTADKYLVMVNLETDEDDPYRYLSATFDGKTKELIRLYTAGDYEYDEDFEATSADIERADKNTLTFLNEVAGDKIAEYQEIGKTDSIFGVNYSFNRMANSIKYISDAISVRYNCEKDKIIGYYLDYNDKASFTDPAEAINPEEAHGLLLEISPLKKIYMLTGGSHKVCYIADGFNTEIDAVTGEEYAPYKRPTSSYFAYTDLDGHWAKEKIEKLSEVQIGFEGDMFLPNQEITRFELLGLFAAGIKDKYYLDFTEEELREVLEGEGVVKKDEAPFDQTLTREEAFVYMIRMAELEDVAKLSNIFKVEYSDGHLLGQGKIGYAAILTGMGVICGDGGSLRPLDTITRAEVAVMVYNYLSR